MNLIEKLGLEKCQAIVDGAPEWAKYWITRDEYHGHIISFPNMTGHSSYLLNDLRTAIADHGQYWYGQSEEKELEQYAVLSQEKIEGGAVFVGDNSAIVQAMRNITDHCTDIRNHISPCTEVIDR